MVFKVLGFVFGMVLNLWGSFGGRCSSSGDDLGVVFGGLGVVLGVLLKTLVSFWIVLDPGRFQERIYSMMTTSFYRFWIDFVVIS